jgi:hypothetical protein
VKSDDSGQFVYELYEILFSNVFEVNVVGVVESVLYFCQSENCPVWGQEKQISKILNVKIPEFSRRNVLIN